MLQAMAEIIGVPTPLAKIARDYESKLAAKDLELADLRRQLDSASERHTRTLAIADMLRLQLADLLVSLRAHRGQLDLAEQNVIQLRDSLPK